MYRPVLTDAARRAAMVASLFVLLGFGASWLLPDTRIPEQPAEAESRQATALTEA